MAPACVINSSKEISGMIAPVFENEKALAPVFSVSEPGRKPEHEGN